MKKVCDVVVLGGGPAGVAAAVRLRELGVRVVLCARPRVASMEGMSERAVMALEGAGLEHARATLAGPFARTAHWAGGGAFGAREWVAERGRFDAALLLDAHAAGVDVRTGVCATVMRGDAWKITLADGARMTARAVIEARGRRASRDQARGPRLLALGQLFGSKFPGGTMVWPWPGGWCWAGNDGHGRLWVQLVGAPRQSGALGPSAWLSAACAHNPALARMLESATALSPPVACAATARLAECIVYASKLRVGDAALCIDPLSGQGVYEAIRGAQVVAAAASTVVGGADPAPVRQFIAERDGELWQYAVTTAARHYAVQAQATGGSFWWNTAREYARLQSPATELNGASAATICSRPVLNGFRIEVRPVVVTRARPRGVWQLNSIELAPLAATLAANPRSALGEIARRLARPVADVSAARRWLVQHGLVRSVLLGLGSIFLAFATAPATFAADGVELIRSHCSGCHRETKQGSFDRISDIRKTPEGWAMTLFRMHQVHHLVLAQSDQDAVVRYLADTQGLAPAESLAGRFALERRPNAQDLEVDPQLTVMCGRCHTNARSALQRRDQKEWLKLAHTHVGQWPSLEYQASGRDRFWWDIATQELPAKLAALYPLNTSAWREWRARPRQNLAGIWLVTGHTPGRGDYSGIAKLSATAPASYSAIYSLQYADGEVLNGESKAIVYTGYEWRGTAQLGALAVHEVYAASADGNQLTGRWFEAGHDESGGDWQAVRSGDAARLIAVTPRALRAGTTGRVILFGEGLTGGVNFGAGTSARVIHRDSHRIEVDLAVAADAVPGYRAVDAGRVRSPDGLVVFRSVDRLEVTPKYGIARLGGGHTQAVAAQFEVVGYIDGMEASGKHSSISLGTLPAAWSVKPFDATAKSLHDEQFAGALDARGRFHPASAGPNSRRPFSGNNVGNLSVIATVRDGERVVEGSSHLIVTVQRWNTPPIY